MVQSPTYTPKPLRPHFKNSNPPIDRWADPADLEGLALRNLYRFRDEYEAEVAARVCR